jgi:hypothetical protein
VCLDESSLALNLLVPCCHLPGWQVASHLVELVLHQVALSCSFSTVFPRECAASCQEARAAWSPRCLGVTRVIFPLPPAETCSASVVCSVQWWLVAKSAHQVVAPDLLERPQSRQILRCSCSLVGRALVFFLFSLHGETTEPCNRKCTWSSHGEVKKKKNQKKGFFMQSIFLRTSR